MGVRAEVKDLDRMFQTSTTTPIIANDFDLSNTEAREELNRLMYSHYDGDTLGVVPQCQCGDLEGTFLLNQVCPKCSTKVMLTTERELEPVLWVGPPKGVNTLMNPQVWHMLNGELRTRSFSILEHLCNPTMPTPPKLSKEANRYLQLKIPRGLNYFHENFDAILALLTEHNLLSASKSRAYRQGILEWLSDCRSRIFCRYLPCPSRLTLITEKTVTSTYSEPTTPMIVDAILTITNTENSARPLSLDVRQARATEAIKKFSKYHQSVMSDVLFGKGGWTRKHLAGSRLHFTFRGVITSISENHYRDELHMPWSMAVMLLEIHLWNKLRNLNYTMAEAIALTKESVLQYHPLVDQLLQELIAESPYGGIPVLLGRNPTLARGSIQLLRVTKINKDPKINAIRLSVLVLKAPNADFDGDALNGTLILDHDMYARVQRLHPDHYVIGLEKPRTLSSHVGIPNTVASTIGAWIQSGR